MTMVMPASGRGSSARVKPPSGPKMMALGRSVPQATGISASLASLGGVMPGSMPVMQAASVIIPPSKRSR